MAIACVTIKAQHHILIANWLGQCFSQRFSSNKSFTEELRHLCCEQVQARRVSSCHHFASIQSAAVRDATVECIVTNSSFSSMMMSSGNTWFSSKVPITTFKNSVALSANTHRMGSPPQVFARHTVAQFDAHPDRCHSCRNLLSGSLAFVHISAASIIWTAWKKCSEGNNWLRIVWRTNTSTVSRYHTRWQPRHVELPQFYHCGQNDYSFDALQAYCFGINIKL